MTFSNSLAVFKGKKQKELFVFDVENSGLLEVDPQVVKTAFMLPYIENSQVFLRLSISRGKTYIQDIGFPGLGQKAITLCPASPDKYPNTRSKNSLIAESDEQGTFVCRRHTLGDAAFGLLHAGHTVRIAAYVKGSRFVVDSYKLVLPATVNGKLSYSETLHESGGNDCYVGCLLPDGEDIRELPCIINNRTLRKHHIEALAEGYTLQVEAALDSDQKNLVVNDIQLPEYPEEFETALTDASLREGKNKPFLRALFSYHPGIYARIDIAQFMLDVVSVEKPVSLSVRLGYQPQKRFIFEFKDVVIPSGHHARVVPKSIIPYPCEFECNIDGIVVKSVISEQKWEKRKESERHKRCRLPVFEKDKSYVLPVNAKLYKNGGVKFFIADVVADKTVEGNFKFHGLCSVFKYTYCEFSLPPSDVRYQVLLTEFLLFGIGGFDVGARVKMSLVKSDKSMRNRRGSYINMWVLMSLDMDYPDISALNVDTPITAKSMFDWTLSSRVHTFDSEQWKQFSKQRDNFAHLAIIGFGPIHPALSVPPVLMRSSNLYRLEPAETLQVWVRKQSASPSAMKQLDNAHWLSALAVSGHKEKPKGGANTKQFTCIGFVEVNHKPDNLGLMLRDAQGNTTIYGGFEKSKYPLSEHQLPHHIHVARCKADGEVIEILEIINNEA